MRQLTFDLPARNGFTRADFFPSASNRAALAMVDDWQNWHGGRLMLIGPKGAGKTHLAHLWAHDAGAQIVQAVDLAQVDLRDLGAKVAVEDAHQITPEGEIALFHLYNLLSNQGNLLITARSIPRDWGIGLPDLLSRVQTISIAQLISPDEALMAAVLIKLFSDRQIAVPPNLIAYLTPRIDRSIGAARDLVAQLDALALSLGRPVTRALAATLLEAQDGPS
jgi:chromosomal replication initiation ATPase DnaA